MMGISRTAILAFTALLLSSGSTGAIPDDVSAKFGAISTYSLTSGILTVPCMAFYDGNSNIQLDAEGEPMVFSATLGTLPGLQFYLLDSARLDPNEVDDCAGGFSAGVYSDLVYLQDSGPANNGKVLSVAMDVVQGAVLTLALRNDFEVVHDPYDSAVELTHTFITLLQQADLAGLEEFLSEAFILQRANGTYHLKADYLQNLPEIGAFSITDVVALQSGNALIVRWQLAIEQVIEGVPFSGTPAPRLSTFIFENGAWRMASHANFNTPAAES